MAISRRKFLGISATAAAASVLPWKFGAKEAAANTWSPALAKWARPVRGLKLYPVTPGNVFGLPAHPILGDPDGIPVLLPTMDPVLPNTLKYDIAATEFTDTLHPAMGGTTALWGYCDNKPNLVLANGTVVANPMFREKRHLAGVIVAVRGFANRLRFTNELPTKHIIPVDTTIPGANQAENRIAVHLHGGYVPWTSDGGPFDWWAPAGNYAAGLSFQNGPGSMLDNIPGEPMALGQADYFYPNDQSTRLMWYHDHAFGITRINAYAGVATGYLCLDPAQEHVMADQTVLNAVFGLLFNGFNVFTTNGAPAVPSILSYVPLVIQEKKFVDATTIDAADPTWKSVTSTSAHGQGSLWYDHVYDPAKWRLLRGRSYKTPPDPSCIAEFFGDTMLVNGVCHPTLTLEAKAYRFHVLNATNARFLNLNLLELGAGETEITTPNLTPGVYSPGWPANLPGPAMYQVGCEGGYLAQPVVHPNTRPADTVNFRGNLFVGPAERPDFVVDFTGMAGKSYVLYNDLGGPYPGGDPINDYYAGNPVTPQAVAGSSPDTRNLLKINIVPYSGGPLNPVEPRPTVASLQAALNAVPRVGIESFLAPIPNPYLGAPLVPAVAVNKVRNLTLNENFDEFGRLRQLVGTTTLKPGTANTYGRLYLDPATEVSNQGDVEIWNVFNLTADTHPMHFHAVNVQILKRQPFRLVSGRFVATGTARGPEPDELGYKETAKMNPGEVITCLMKIQLPTVPFTVPASNRTGNNEYVWHCHILEHEEHDMMRPFVIV